MPAYSVSAAPRSLNERNATAWRGPPRRARLVGSDSGQGIFARGQCAALDADAVVLGAKHGADQASAPPAAAPNGAAAAGAEFGHRLGERLVRVDARERVLPAGRPSPRRRPRNPRASRPRAPRGSDPAPPRPARRPASRAPRRGPRRRPRRAVPSVLVVRLGEQDDRRLAVGAQRPGEDREGQLRPERLRSAPPSSPASAAASSSSSSSAPSPSGNFASRSATVRHWSPSNDVSTET